MKRGAVNKIRSLATTRAVLVRAGEKVLRTVESDYEPNGPTDPPGYNLVVDKYPSGYRVGVGAYSTHAKRHDRKHNTLLRALNSAR